MEATVAAYRLQSPPLGYSTGFRKAEALIACGPWAPQNPILWYVWFGCEYEGDRKEYLCFDIKRSFIEDRWRLREGFGNEVKFCTWCYLCFPHLSLFYFSGESLYRLIDADAGLTGGSFTMMCLPFQGILTLNAEVGCGGRDSIMIGRRTRFVLRRPKFKAVRGYSMCSTASMRSVG